jgi:hypothetical protein
MQKQQSPSVSPLVELIEWIKSNVTNEESQTGEKLTHIDFDQLITKATELLSTHQQPVSEPVYPNKEYMDKNNIKSE